MAPSSRRGVLVSLLLPVYLPAGLSTTAQTLLVPFLPLWLRGRMWSKPLAGPSSPPGLRRFRSCAGGLWVWRTRSQGERPANRVPSHCLERARRL